LKSPAPADVAIHSATVQAGRSHCANNQQPNLGGQGAASMPLLRLTYVVVDIGRPSGRDLDARKSVGSNGRNERPVFILSVQQDRSRVVADHEGDAAVAPRFKGIAIV
jgi:hypothetical protein